MSSSILLTLLVICAILFFLGGILVILSGVALFFVLGRGGDDPEEPAMEAALPRQEPARRVERPEATRPVRPVPSAPEPAPEPLRPAGLAPMPARPRAPDVVEDDGGKTEVFTRGSLDLDWDDEHVEGDNTEIFRSDVHGVDDADPEFKID